MAKQTNPPAASDSAPENFENAMAELESLVARMEAGELPLDASVVAYRRGAELVRFCTAQLDRVDGQVKVLDGEMLKPLRADAAIGAGE
jgi:exodeoxyribonuclease VII small subunit